MNICIDIPSPQIVAKQSFIGKTAAIPLTNIYTPPSDGDFRVDIYIAIAPSSSVTANILWTDEYTSRSRVISYPGDISLHSFVVHSVGGIPIQLETNGILGTFDLFITIIQE